MSYVPMEKLLKNGASLFKLTILAAQRALALGEGSKRLIPDSAKKKISTVALNEIREEKVRYEIVDDEAATEVKKDAKDDK